ncbi:FO synthase [Microbacterium lemovicicum]|uniref:7,8-didemethyl-8-hydroxy-5-deazariboflavin synthase n=1 Tax=Microbacterium lemovicicum TaxID=1072463 RepID=A0A3S9WEC6_9MICO|nr:7,8-didemethyl-8-hydroxy-5-deazariboflavin synthase CofG [Microbacterium lemovicicum]AZS38394.1 FO synthase [Microbacterium lemovicicum]
MTVTEPAPTSVRSPLPPAQRSFADALARAAAGLRLDADDAEALLSAEGDDAARVRALAAEVRDAGLREAGRPGVITYSRKVFVPLTTLCRDRCHYCIFVDTPGQLLTLHKPVYMTPEQVLAVVRQGAALGCKEALLTLGDRPEDRWPAARAWLDEHGFASTIDYVAHVARLITAETGMLVHANPGVMTEDELRMLRPVAPSMGMMLETTSRRLFEEPGQVHYGSPDKDPDLRLRVIEDAGRLAVPFTTGILVGIGETVRDRAESLVALRDAQERHHRDGVGHVQEVIVQNFRAKPRTAMQSAPDAGVLEYVAAVAVARLVMGARMRIQVPPNLSDPQEFALLVEAGADDWGGVSPLTADHVNPERPWPHLSDLAERTAELGFELRERLTAHPEYVAGAEAWIDPALRPAVEALADPQTRLARADTVPQPAAGTAPHVTGGGRDRGIARLAEAAASSPSDLGDDDWSALLTATGDDLAALVSTADDVRRYTVGEAVSLVVNRNLASSGLRSAPQGVGEYSLDEAAQIARDAGELGATEICIQGRMPRAEPADAYLDLVRTVKTAAPGIHVHAYRPQDVVDLAERGGLDLTAALELMRAVGVGSVPGTGVKVLDERVRRLVAPDDLPIDAWFEAMSAAHRAGFRSTSVLFYGHVETARERVAHLRALRRLQDAAQAAGGGGGFSEFVPIPLPGPQGGVPLVAGRAPLDEHRAMVAVSRLLLTGSIPHIQIPWTRVGREHAVELLRAGGDDLGGTLLDGRVRPDAGVEQGLELPLADAARLVGRLFRPFRQRTTDYREPPADRRVAS